MNRESETQTFCARYLRQEAIENLTPAGRSAGASGAGRLGVCRGLSRRSAVLCGCTLCLEFHPDFLAVDRGRTRGRDAHADLSAPDRHDLDLDVVADDDGFAGFPGENEHAWKGAGTPDRPSIQARPAERCNHRERIRKDGDTRPPTVPGHRWLK
jgi:hypothetical protein